MPAVANVRVNTQVPFPALVTGSAPITVTKTIGSVWQVGFTIAAFGSQNPPVGNFPTDFLLGYDSNANVFFKISLTNLLASLTPAASVRFQRLATSSPIVITGTDQIINVNISSGSPSCTLPTAASRAGNALTFKDVGGNFGAHNLTITPAGGDNIDGGGAIVLGTNRQAVTLVPANDGVTTGWSIE
jgi:hypothetical protein